MLRARTTKKKKMTDNSPLTMNHLLSTGKGQVLLEFTFCMIIVLLMIYGVTKVFIWTGRDFAERAIAHDTKLKASVSTEFGCSEWTQIFVPVIGYIDVCIKANLAVGPSQQIDPYFYTPVKMNAIWAGSE